MTSRNVPPWYRVYQHIQCWIAVGVFEALVHNRRRFLREIARRASAAGGAAG